MEICLLNTLFKRKKQTIMLPHPKKIFKTKLQYLNKIKTPNKIIMKEKIKNIEKRKSNKLKN